MRRGIICLLVGFFPQDRRAALWTDHGIPTVLQHGDTISHANSQRATGTAFANHNANNGRAQPAHLAQVHRDGLGLSALLAVKTWIRAGRVNESDDWHVELFSEFHFQKSFAIALGIGATKAALDALFSGASLVMANKQTL